MARRKKLFSTMAMVDNKQNEKVKEEEDENINTEEKKKQIKDECDKKKEEKQRTLKNKLAKYKEDKEKKTRNNGKKDNGEKGKRGRKKRKENEKVEARKEREEEKQNDKDEELKESDEKDPNDKLFCPSFFRAVIDSSMEQATIPLDFRKYLEDCTGVVSLRGPSGNKWPVELAKISGELCFGRGWKEFISDHRVAYGCLLVFFYDGQSQFSVKVYLPSSCEAPDALVAQPQRKDTSQDTLLAKPQRIDALQHTLLDQPQRMDVDADDAGPQDEKEEALPEIREKEKESERRMSMDDALKPSQQQEEDQSKINCAPGPEQDDGYVVGKRRSRKVDDITAELDRSNKSKAPARDSASEGKASRDSLVELEPPPSKKSKAEGKRSLSGDLAELEPPPSKKSKAEGTRSPSGDLALKGAASSDTLEEELEPCPSKKSKAEGTRSPSGDLALKGAASSDTSKDRLSEELEPRPSKKSKAEGTRSPSGDLASKGAASSNTLKELEPPSPKKSKAEGRRSPSGDLALKGATPSDTLEELELPPPKKSKAKGKRPGRPPKKSKASASKGVASINSLAVRTSAPDSMGRELVTLHNSFGCRPTQCLFPMFNTSNGETQPGRVLRKVQKRSGLESQRRPVTDKEKEDTLQRAQRFSSEKPFAIKVMNHTNVYASYFMILPGHFVQEFLPKKGMKMTLWDPQATPWKVWYEYIDGECPLAAFSSGWGALAEGNNLERWDVCVFELLDQDYNIKVHVHRVVREITPCVLAPNAPILESIPA